MRSISDGDPFPSFTVSFQDDGMDLEDAIFQFYFGAYRYRRQEALGFVADIKGAQCIMLDPIRSNNKQLECTWLGKVLTRPRVVQIYRGITGAEACVVRYLGEGSEREIVLSTHPNPLQLLLKRRVSSIQLPSICVTDPTACLLHAYEIAVQCNERSKRQAGR